MEIERQKYQILAALVDENFKINAMKTIHTITTLSIVSLLLASCTVSNVPYAYDDLYYSPSADAVQQARIDLNYPDQATSQNGTYSDRYNQEDGTNSNAENYQESYATENTDSEMQQNEQVEQEYYDEGYAETLQQINAPVRSFNTYDPYQRDRILYTQNPVFAAPSIYGGFQFWDPFLPTAGLSVGWNSYNGWNVGVNYGYGFGCGRALNPYTRYYDPFWGNNRGWNDPYWGNRNGWGNNWGWNNGYNNYAYRNGYNNGYRDGSFNNYSNYAVGNNGSGRRQIIAPRGGAGSTNVNRGTGTRPVRPVRGGKTGGVKATTPAPATTNTRPTRPVRSNSTRPAVQNRPVQTTQPNRSTATRPMRTTTPPKYQTPNRPASYTKPAVETRPVRSTPTRPTTQPSAKPQRPTYNRPAQQQARPTNSRPATRPAQQQARPRTTPQPRQQTRPKKTTQPRQQSRPAYNNSKPTYSAPRSTGSGNSGRSSTPSRGTTTTRPSRR